MPSSQKLWKLFKWTLSGQILAKRQYLSAEEGLSQTWLSDVFVVSYPKSGRTWFRFMLGGYIATLVDQGYTEVDYASRIYKTAKGIPQIAFTHDHSSFNQYRPLSASQLPESKAFYGDSRVILIARDPRDVIVSYYMHCTQREGIYAGTISEFIRDEYFGLEKVVTFLNNWLTGQHSPKGFMMIRYEEMLEDPVAVLVSCAEFIGLPADKEIAEVAAVKASLENMKQLERAGALGSDGRFGKGLSGTEDGYKVRQGRAGAYGSSMSEADQIYCSKYIRANLSKAFGYV